MSQCRSIVTPMPTARPLTAATIGVRALASAGSSGLASSVFGAELALQTAAKSARSLPAGNMSPCDLIKMQRMLGSLSAAAILVARVLYMARVSAFFLSGRLSVSIKSLSDFSTRTCSVTRILLPVFLRRRLAQPHDKPKEKGRSNQTRQYTKLQFRSDMNQTRYDIGKEQQQGSGERGREQNAAGLMAQQRPHQVRGDESDKSDDSRHRCARADRQCRAEYRQKI